MNNTLTVEKLFSGRLLRVPDYQRGYAWDKKNWTDFLEDLDLLPRGKHHYTGTVVLDRVTKPPEGEAPEPTVWDVSGFGYEVFNIVDGQQRLTTVVLLLDAIRRELARFPEQGPLARGTTAAYVRVLTAAGESLHKLELNADTNGFWVNSVLADAPGPEPAQNASQKRLSTAKAHFTAYLAQQRDARGGAYLDWLLALRTKVTSNLVFVPYEVSTSAEVGVIFEVMNDRGKQLTELEKAKNYLLYLASKLDLPPHSLAETVNATWAAVFGRLMAAGLSESRFEDQLLRAHWLMAYDPDRRSWEGTASVKRKLGLRVYDGRHTSLLQDSVAYVGSLGSASLAYSEILSPVGGFAAPLTRDELERLRIERASRRLLRVGATATFLPLLMATRLRYPEDAEHYAEMLGLCELFAFRVYRLLGKYANSGQSSFFRLAHEVYTGKRDQASAVRRMRELTNWYSPNKEFEAALSETRERRWYPWGGLKYLLYEWEERLAGKKAVLLSWEKVEQRDLAKTIEHILPQTPTDEYWLARFSPEDRERLTHDLGNLVLTEDNSSYLNHSFDRKRGQPGDRRPNGDLVPCYANSILFQERALAGLPEWTPAAVTHRRKELLAWARQRWHVDEVAAAEGVAAEDEEIDEGETVDGSVAAAAM
jgi:hypothetical protein